MHLQNEGKNAPQMILIGVYSWRRKTDRIILSICKWAFSSNTTSRLFCSAKSCAKYDIGKLFCVKERVRFIVMQEASDAHSKTADSDTVSTYQVSSVQLVTDKKLEAFNKA